MVTDQQSYLRVEWLPTYGTNRVVDSTWKHDEQDEETQWKPLSTLPGFTTT